MDRIAKILPAEHRRREKHVASQFIYKSHSYHNVYTHDLYRL